MNKRLLTVGLVAVTLLAAGCNANSNNTNNMNQTMMHEGSAELTLHQDMRKLWTDHVVWTREYIVAAAAGAPNAQAAATRLLKNQEDIGNAVAPYYGADAGNKLTALLKDHINIAVDLIADAKAGNTTKFNTDNDRWKQNANDIADFLSNANPDNWPQSTMRDMMAKHLSTTTDEVTATLNKNYDQSVKDFDIVYDHILSMADTLSDGIVKQFPDKFQ